MANLNLINADAPKNRFFFNDKANLFCQEGFKYYNGSQSRTCLSDKTWSGRPLVCTGIILNNYFVKLFKFNSFNQEQKCDNSVLLSTNAKLVSLSNKLYEKAEFKCKDNERVVSGNLIRYCTPLSWSGRPAFCEGTKLLHHLDQF